MITKESMTIIREALVAAADVQAGNITAIEYIFMLNDEELSEQAVRDLIILRQRIEIVKAGIEVIDAEMVEIEEDHDKTIIDS